VVSGDSLQSLESSFVNAPNFDPAGKHWQAMTKNAEPILKEYKASSSGKRKETRRVLDATLLEIDPQSLEGQVLAYLVGRLDEIDAAHHQSRSKQSE
jgi:hypothetical protein